MCGLNAQAMMPPPTAEQVREAQDIRAYCESLRATADRLRSEKNALRLRVATLEARVRRLQDKEDGEADEPDPD